MREDSDMHNEQDTPRVRRTRDVVIAGIDSETAAANHMRRYEAAMGVATFKGGVSVPRGDFPADKLSDEVFAEQARLLMARKRERIRHGKPHSEPPVQEAPEAAEGQADEPPAPELPDDAKEPLPGDAPVYSPAPFVPHEVQ